MRLPSLCDSCRHLRTRGTSCAAFPERIPEEIRTWGDPHFEPRAGQGNGTVYEFSPSAKDAKDAWDKFRTA